MQNEELIAEIKAQNNVNKNMEQLYTQNRRFIYGIAKKYSCYAEIDDLMQEAYFALVNAVEKYDLGSNCKFLTYFSYWLVQRFQHYIDDNRRTKRIPVHMRERIAKYEKVIAEYAAIGKEATDSDICRELDITEKQFENLRKAIFEKDCISLNERIPGTDDVSFEDMIPDSLDLEADVTDSIARMQLKDQLWSVVYTLADKERIVIQAYYKELIPLVEIAKQLNCSTERIRQLRNKAIKILYRNKDLQKLAEDFGYLEGSRAYKGSVVRFKDTGTSCVEALALRHMELEEQKKRMEQQRNQSMNELFEQVLNLASR